MDRIEEFEKRNEIESRLNILKAGAKYLGADFKISEAFSNDRLPAQLPSFYKKADRFEEAREAIEWWISLPQELKIKYDQ